MSGDESLTEYTAIVPRAAVLAQALKESEVAWREGD
jgi:hypothetical protein